MSRLFFVFCACAFVLASAGCESSGPDAITEVPSQPSAHSAQGGAVDGEAVGDYKPAGLGLQIKNAHMYELAPGQSHAAVYMVVSNEGDKTRQLVDISTPVAGTAMVHRTFYEDGMMRMRHVHHVNVAPKQSLVFEPNSYHVMLMDLESIPAAGETFVLTMDFDQGQSVSVDVAVKSQN